MPTPLEKPLPKRPQRFEFEDDPAEPTGSVKPLSQKGLTIGLQHRRQQSFETPEAKAKRLEKQNTEHRATISRLESRVRVLEHKNTQQRRNWKHEMLQATLRHSQSVNQQLAAQEEALKEMIRAINTAFENFKVAYEQAQRNSKDEQEEIHIFRDSGSSSESFF
ncbi:hypothetical protein CDEST_14408 [Colletotrichum destructivum]|uniref:BZIP domain-containing protein n=1 Tax=Colletotrichum destructivum TaxID=34406 RepID=A0AAX4J1H0_9PEZI|nr:hypothetical protein CDEST_14408 [Colletotrichum destructivum]